MKNKFFSKYFYSCVFIFIFMLGLFGAILIVRSEKICRENNCNLSYTTARMIQSECNQINNDNYTEILEKYALSFGISCYLFDTEGDMLACSHFLSDEISLPKELLNKKISLPYWGEKYFKELNDTATVYYIEEMALPSQTCFFIIQYMEDDMNSYSDALWWGYLILLLCFAVCTAIISYISVKHALKPVLMLTETAEEYTKGNFSYRIDHDGADELGHLFDVMNHMAEMISENEKSRKAFISNVSHELRTPMTTIGGFVDGILDGTIPEQEQKRYLKKVSSEIKRLARLVNSMLNISKFEEGEMQPNFTEIEISRIIIETLFHFETGINAKQVEPDLEELHLCKIQADKDLIQQVFYNLIENAVKFVDEKGSLKITSQIEEDEALITIQNSGEGLSEEELSKVFQRFYKTDESRGKDTTGVGLGLSIVSRIIQIHNGKILVKSVKNSYTLFEIHLPLVQTKKKSIKENSPT